MPSFFVPEGPSSYAATEHVTGAWNVAEQHISPMNGLVVHELERWLAARGVDDGRVLTRLCIEILGVLDLGTSELRVEVVRGGRSVELLEVVVANGGRDVVRARAWRMSRSDTSSIAGGAELHGPPLPAPGECPPYDLATTWPGGYIRTLDLREAAPSRPGRTITWLTTSAQLVSGEPSSDLARLVGLVDTANGIATRVEPGEAVFPNVDLTIHCFRQPTGSWVGLDTMQVFGADGTGLTSSVLHDLDGPFGRAEQSLFVRART